MNLVDNMNNLKYLEKNCVPSERNNLNLEKNELNEENEIKKNNYVSIENLRCSEHLELPIQFFCVNCKTHCFCGECAIRRHGNCEPLGLKESRIRIETQFIKRWISDLVTRSETLRSAFRQVLLDRRDSYGLVLQDLNCKLVTLYSLIVIPILEDIKRNMLVSLSNHETLVKQFCCSQRDTLQTFLVHLEDVSKSLRSYRNLNPYQLLLFYRCNYHILTQFILSNTFSVSPLVLRKFNDNTTVENSFNYNPQGMENQKEFKDFDFNRLREKVNLIKNLNNNYNNKFKNAMSILNNLQNNIRIK